MNLLKVPDTVQRDIVYGLLFLVEAKEEPSVVVLLDVVRMNGPVVGYIIESLVLDVQYCFIDDGIKDILEPIKAGIILGIPLKR